MKNKMFMEMFFSLSISYSIKVLFFGIELIFAKNMESQASLMVNCMLLAFQRLRLYADVDNNNYTNFTNITSTFNFTLDTQSANDSLETNDSDSPSYNRNIYQ